ncbi:MAG: amino acid adenylation domain-containing protein, partial [bacterium]|nr:amino acid adenylation domain-containing protein [bacterium]
MEETVVESGFTGLEIAVIGMSGRFPQAKNIDEFWENLKEGRECIEFFSHRELKENGITDEQLNDPTYVKAFGWMDDIDQFDALFFGYTPLEAEIMDPQLCVFHETVLEALESAGYDPFGYRRLIGLYAGASENFFWQARVTMSGKGDAIGWFATKQLREKDFLATRIAHRLNLKGPAITMDTACSTSLVAIHMACQGLFSGDCDIAVAGGVSISSTAKQGYVYQEGGTISPDGHCRAFDTGSKGCNIGNGSAAVVLKRFDDARSDGDSIYAVIRGTSINNDGTRKASYTAPSIEGQSQAIRAAQQMAEIDPETIGYVETHGTGTALGDPVEVEGLKAAFNTSKRHFCRIGSVKTNLGHLDVAAGVTGFLKTVLILKHGLIPPSLFFETPNPRIDFENSPFIVNTTLTKWQANGHPRRAGVSSFGIGGTNAHAVLEQAPPLPENPPPMRPFHMLLLSARSESALRTATGNLKDFLEKNPATHLADAAYTLQVGRRVHKHRRMMVVPDVKEALSALSGSAPGKVKTLSSKEDNRSIVFMFPGLGSQYVNMGRGLYDTEPFFREEMDRCFEILNRLMAENIKEILYPQGEITTNNKTVTGDVSDPAISQVVIFIFEYALSKLLIHWGIKPNAMIGYSFGEYMAACISGVFSLADALKLVVARGQWVEETPEGAMLSIPLPMAEVESMLETGEDVSVAIDNGPSCVVSGPSAAIGACERRMKEKRLMCMRVPASRAIHSKLMTPILEKFKQLIGTITLNPPGIPYISNVTGQWITPQEAADPGYWVRHLSQTVRFADGMKKLLKESGSILVEVGPSRDIGTLAKRHIQDLDGDNPVINMVKHPHREMPDTCFLLNQVGWLWLYGQPIDWEAFYSGDKKQYRRIFLPTYPFERQKYWLEKSLLGQGARQWSGASKDERKPDIADWFYVPSWLRCIPFAGKPRDIEQHLNWLVFVDEAGLANPLLERLETISTGGLDITTVDVGETFEKSGEGVYCLDPGDDRHYTRLFKELNRSGRLPDIILHMWSLDPEEAVESRARDDFSRIHKVLDRGYYSLLNIARSVGEVDADRGIRIIALSNRMHDITGSEGIEPIKASLLGPVRSIPPEYTNLSCQTIDIPLPRPGSAAAETLLLQLLHEITSGTGAPVMAFRDSHRWKQAFVPMRLESTGSGNIPLLLKKKGVYLITGGLGGIGFALAGYLAGTLQASLIITGRTAIDSNNSRQQKISDLEQLGARVAYFSADAENLHQMETVISGIPGTFGPLNGVIHAAGIADGALIQRRSREDSKQVFAAKIKGTLVLEQVLEGVSLDFFVCCSSIASVLNQFGQAGYIAANNFLDAFAGKNFYQGGFPVISINWDRWQSVGIATIVENQHKRFGGENLSGGISIPEGIDTLERILASSLPQVIVSPKDLETGIERSRHFKASAIISAAASDDGPGSSHPKPQFKRPQLDTPYVAPETPVQRTLSRIWQHSLGYHSIGIKDDFFDLGGDSLKAINLISVMHKELNIDIPLKEFFDFPTISDVSRYISGADFLEFQSLEPVETKEYYPLSSAQKRLYFIQMLDQSSIGYNIPLAMKLTGNLDMDKLKDCLGKLVQRHESLRTSFHMIDNQPVQKIHDHVEFEIEFFGRGDPLWSPLHGNHSVVNGNNPGVNGNHSGTHGGEPLQPIRDFVRPFDLSHAPLIRSQLVRMTPGNHQGNDGDGYTWMIDIHHIISDGVSMGVLVKEFMALYEGRELPQPRLQYKDYSHWEKQGQERIRQQEEFWLKEFEDEIPLLDLPLDYSRPKTQEFEGALVKFEIDADHTRALKELALDRGMTLYSLLLAIYTIFIARISNQETIVVGTPTAGRRHADLEQIIGMFVDTLALKNEPRGEKTFHSFLEEVNHKTLNAFSNQDYHYEDLVERVMPNRDAGRNPLFDTMLVLQNIEVTDIENVALKLSPYDFNQAIAKFDLTLLCTENDQHLACEFEYSTALFKEETIRRFSRYFITLASNPTDSLEKKISDINILSIEEKRQLVMGFNDTAEVFPKDKTIYRWIEEQVEHIPDHVALVGEITNYDSQVTNQYHGFVTYAQLNEKANRLAHYLYNKKGIRTGQPVAVLMERSMELIIALTGVMKAGGAYVPLDPSLPPDRLKVMFNDASIGVVISQQKFIEKLTPLKNQCHAFHSVLSMDDPPMDDPQSIISESPAVSPDTPGVGHPAYVMYTSGSSGTPKGVLVEHRTIVNTLIWRKNYYDYQPGDVSLRNPPYFFDSSVTDIFTPLLGGARLVLVPEEKKTDLGTLKQVIPSHNVSHFIAVPAFYNVMLEEISHALIHVKHICVAGEHFPDQLIRKHFDKLPQVRISNEYGPTENSVNTTAYELKPDSTKALIGKPISNAQVYVLDKYLTLCPIGVTGQLCLAGSSLARGYLNRPEITAEKFVVPSASRFLKKAPQKLLS